MDIATAQYWYNVARKVITVLPILAGISGLFIDAPFGRFAPTTDSIFLVNGKIAWFCMEFPPLLTFPYFFITSPLAISPQPMSLTHPSTILAALFVIHYINRSIISVLRMPSRSRIHMAVIPVTSVFNAANGFAMATYLSSPFAQAYLFNAFSRPTFYVFMAMWASGFIGNIIHDEVLYELRRNAKSEDTTGEKKARHSQARAKTNQEYYGVPYGLLYDYISFPNYLCELLEWLSFALAAAPPPSIFTVLKSLSALSFHALLFADVPPEFGHPYIFLIGTLLPMVPRAYRGHHWYQKRFPYPERRKAILPFVF